MVQLIVGKKGKGKTKQLLDKVNGAIKAAEGNIVYLDKSSKHMYELNNKVRLIDVSGQLPEKRKTGRKRYYRCTASVKRNFRSIQD